MNIMVFDVPAEYGGALSILEEYYTKAINNKDKNIQWIFVVSKPIFKDHENVKVLRFPWVKKSWGHRLIFDLFIAPKLVEKYRVDEILSLQNVFIPGVTGIKQSLYIHQSLPFVDYKFKFSENKLFWFYQNIMGRIIVKSIKKADHVIVQTNWMKTACIDKSNESSLKFEVRPPEINIEVENNFASTKETLKTFFYPAGSGYYKNHRLIVEACKKLVEEGLTDFKVFLTLSGDEDQHIIDLKNIIIKFELPVYLLGKISREEVFNYYTKSVLVFPSYIESSPLPLTEGKLHNTKILASNCEFSKEILIGYKEAYYFDWNKSEDLAKLMKMCLLEKEKVSTI
ncbi:glycosyltransferase [Rossellomorea vietnamensis]|uniref:glycosyltransferase n=1 Tax=Rossellomorea vietnamensis TaxID=218284 RepID=UPI001E4FF13C|nr:glycosyltransferase [Rossellomorea vietnamensis]MCC5803214.1 glycosyltransferase [Rossellomorea vietnamensis]